MLGMIFRGVFLISILTWYSTSVWKMIDGYFRDQFRNYLEEEYRKNPRMRSDVEAVDKVAPVSTTPRPETTVASLEEVPEDPEVERAVEVAENDSTTIEASEKEQVTGGSSENEAATGSTDKNAFLGTTMESGLESRKSSESEEESRRSINHDGRDPEGESRGDDHRSATPKTPRKSVKADKKATMSKDTLRGNARRRAVKTITLTERDFKSTRKKEASKDDFWEFEEDADEKEPLQGVLVSELPYKPRADIGDIERVTADEYCPLTLEDEASCGETAKWP
ncbi:uncharacterized protein LOC143182521 [Calliopsis andreniformis]|uniref:uncharacterized protein LOC143182521 n=1 Tax=Calliopsis andreniformis TaxID=337506 RepID=UPI003FCECD2E